VSPSAGASQPRGRIERLGDAFDLLAAYADGGFLFERSGSGVAVGASIVATAPLDAAAETLGDGVDANESPFQSTFPFIAYPHSGSDASPHPGVETGAGSIEMAVRGVDDPQHGCRSLALRSAATGRARSGGVPQRGPGGGRGLHRLLDLAHGVQYQREQDRDHDQHDQEDGD